MNAWISLGIVAAGVLGVLVFASLAARRADVDPQEFIVGGRSFGALFLWILLAGEIYTSFTVLGAAGWAYGKGAPAFYILCYGTVAFVLSYFFLPPIWTIAKERLLLTQADFFADRYGSRRLGMLVAAIGFVFLVPYVTLQLTGLEILLRIAGYSTLNSTTAVGIAFALMTAFVYANGLRGTAWASVVKDAVVVAAVAFAGIALPIRFFGSPEGAIDRVLATRPHWLTLANDLSAQGTTWFVSTVALTALGFYMWPHSFSAIFSARDAATLRKNAIFLPFYQLMLLLVYFAGFTALLVVPGLKGTAADQSFLLVVQRYYPPWVLGSVAFAGCLAALVPASGQILGAASLFTKNVLGDGFGIATSDAERLRTTRILVVVVAALALGWWLAARTSLVGLLLIGYSGVTQFFPGVVLALGTGRFAAAAVGAGIACGIVVVILAAALAMPTLFGLNVGLFALFVNVAVAVATNALLPKRRKAATRAPSSS
ncbi:MAG: sodium:solute symporter family protein [Candidatus Eremiobacteraeota bacterium]|nr:sodium:solute symporter family protein [Candidatus Eremiobacteraeota bacterium]